MYNSYNPDKVFKTSSQKSLEDTILDTTYSFLSNSIQYVIPVAAGLMIGSGILSENKSVVTGVVVNLCSGYIQCLNYRNDVYHLFGNIALGNELNKELNLRSATGFLRGVLEGGALIISSAYMARYLEHACSMVK